MLKKAKIFVLVGASLMVGALLAAGATSGAGDVPPPHHDPTPAVRVETVEKLDRGRDLRFSSTVRARDRAAVAVTVAGRVVARPVQVGDQSDNHGQGEDKREPGNGAAASFHAVEVDGIEPEPLGKASEDLLLPFLEGKSFHQKGEDLETSQGEYMTGGI